MNADVDVVGDRMPNPFKLSIKPRSEAVLRLLAEEPVYA